MNLKLDVTITVIILSFIALFIKNNILQLSTFILLICISIVGNIIIYYHSDTLSKYYDLSKKMIYIVNIINHIILPIILLYYLFNNIKNIENIDNLRLPSLLFIFILAIIYIILMKYKLTSNYGLSSKNIIKYITICVIIISISLYKISSILNLIKTIRT